MLNKVYPLVKVLGQAAALFPQEKTDKTGD